MSRSRLAAAAAGLGLLFVGATAFAGLRALAPAQAFTIGDVTIVHGAFGDTRNTADSTQRVMCGTNSNYGFCSFLDPQGKYYACYTLDPAYLAVIRSMDGDSRFEFDIDATSMCSYLLSGVDTAGQPRTP